VPLLYSILFGLKKEYYQPGDYAPEKDNTGIPIQYKEQSMSNQKNKEFMQTEQPKPWIID
jgi:hypothetical protein